MRKVVLTLAAIVSVALCSAQMRGGTITLEDAVNLTMESNPTLKALEYEEKAAKRERQAAIGLFMPNISVKGAYSYLGKDVDISFNDLKGGVSNAAGELMKNPALGAILQDPQLGPIVQPILSDMQGGLNTLLGLDWAYTLQKQSFGFIGGDVTMPIFMGGKIIAANKAAKINEKTIVEQGAQQRNALMSEIVERYFGYALALNVIDVRRQVVAGMEQHLRDIQSLEKNGMVAQTERLYVEYKLAEAQRELLNSELQAETVGSALCNTIGTDSAATPVTAMFVMDAIETLEYYQRVAEDNNPLLNQVDLKRQLAKQNVNVHRADFFPQIVAMGGGTFYNYQVTKMLPRWAVGVGFNFKIFDGLNREYKYSAAKNTMRRVEALQTKAEKDIAILVESIYNKMINYRNQITSIESSIAFAEEYLRAKNAAYLEGMGTSTDLIDAELNLAKVKIERMQAAYNFDLYLAKLLEAAGISDEFMTYSRGINARQITYNKQ